MTEAQASIVRRLEPALGLRVSCTGSLTRPEMGHPRGRRYVVIQADSAMDRSLARQLLAGEADTTDLQWDYGWSARRRADGRQVTELTIFPSSD